MDLIADKIKKLWEKHEFRIVLVIGLILVAVISFESGYLKGKNVLSSPIVVEKTVLAQNSGPEAAQGSIAGAQNLAQEAKINATGSNIPPQNCAYVGSKNSNKYHLPTCHFAKLIKPENIVCFSSAEDATAKKYLPDKGCVK